MPRTYTMRGVMGAADRAVELARAYFLWRMPRSRVHDVQLDPRFQHRGIDLLWEEASGHVQSVEVKGDRQAGRGNFFFELVSNVEKDTPGCFLYSEADWLAYVFLARRELFLLPLADTRAWFLADSGRFETRATRTRAGQSHYTTVGALVPIRAVREGVRGALVAREGAAGFVGAN